MQGLWKTEAVMAADLLGNAWEGFLGVVEPHLPEYLHWNEICVSLLFILKGKVWPSLSGSSSLDRL